jgi:peptide methionine sulfoxide reductase MsrA
MPNPDYNDLKDHSETTQIQFNHDRITYTELLEIFWQRHDYATPIEAQYKSAIFYNSEQQRQEAEASLALVKQGRLGQAELRGREVRTLIAPAAVFYVAELYHQKYFLQCNREIFSLLSYSRREDLIDDIVATSLNGYLHGSGTVGAFMAEVDTWPLPFKAKFAILHHVTNGEHLADFRPIDESHIENPLPGPFRVHKEDDEAEAVASHVLPLPTPSRARNDRKVPTRTYQEITSDFIDVFPTKTAKC